jgi:hypothetical protein
MSEHEERRRSLRRHRPRAIDVLVDPRTRPIAAWAIGMVAIGTALFHWLEG